MSLLDAPPTTTAIDGEAVGSGAQPSRHRGRGRPLSVETREQVAARYTFAVARISLGFVFLWAFVDKLVGLDHATPAARAWLNGGSPSTGFLTGVEGPFAGFFNSIAGSPADWLFMAGLLGIGAGVRPRHRHAHRRGQRRACCWCSCGRRRCPIATNPFLDDHLVYAVVMIGLALMHAGNTVGLGTIWRKLAIVRRFPALI